MVNRLINRQGTTALLLLLLLIAALTLPACSTAVNAGKATTIPVVLSGKTFHLEVAADEKSREQGLSDRKSIASDGGMIFVFRDVDRRSFWMKRCLVGIDILFLDPGGRIIQMHEMEAEQYDTPEDQLQRYSSVWPAQFAIELASGQIQKLGVTTGQKVDLPIKELTAHAE